MISRYALLVLFLLWRINMVLGQCTDPDFTLLTAGCIDQNIKVENPSPGFDGYKWDFCSGDFALTPNSTISASNTLLFRTRSMRVVKSDDTWFGFAIDQANSPYRLIRFNFGASLVNTPSITNLGNPLNLLNGAYDFQLYKEGSNWYGLVANTGGNNILRYNFGTNLESTPVVQNLGSFGELSTPNGIFLVNNNGSLHAFVSNGGVSKITRLDFGSSINNTPTASSFSIAGGSTLRGISITRECDRWFGLVTSYSNGKVFWLDFNNGLTQPPQSGEISFFTSYNFPASVSIVSDGGEYYAMIQSAVGPLYRLSFGASIIDKTGVGVNLGNFGVSENFACEWAKDNSNWIGFSIDLGNRRLIRYTLPTVCDASQSVYTGQTPPPIKFSSSGTKKITLVTSNSSGLSSTISKSVIISSSVSPDINFSSQNICSNHDVLFTSQNSSNDISTYEWSFGDLNTSSSPSPTYQYTAAGEYTVKLDIEATNGCLNFIEQPIKIYDPPSSSFTLPTGLICTNNEFIFVNSTTDSFDGNLSYQWSVDATPVSDDRDLLYTFDSGGSKEIKLLTSIPGCTSETTQVLANVGEGPVVDFSIDGNCLNESIQFTNNSTGDIDTYAWDFGNGEVSSETSPSLLYAGAGIFDVELQTLGVNGCTSTKVIAHQIYSLPQPSFNIDLPPFSCNGSPTQFNDLTPPLTDSNLDSWQWNFGDGTPGSNAPSPQHTYDLSGVYSVMLTVVSDQGCSSQVMQDITISEAPTPVITNSPACINVGVELSETSGIVASAWQWQIGNTFYFTKNPSHVFGLTGDYSISLMLTSENGCVGTTLKEINVPDPLSVDFESTKKCVGTESQFTALSSGSFDLPSTYLWKFNGEERSGAISNYTFATEGLQEVQLTVITESGCSYSINKAVTILPTPQADFSFTPTGGAPPLAVQFTNLSTNTSVYRWSFNDTGNTTSTATAPSFVFTEVGNYPVDLLASNEEGCESTLTRLVSVALPLLNVSLESVELLENPDGSIRILSDLQNNGNLNVQNLVLEIELSNGTRLRETLQESLSGGEQITYQLSTIIGNTTDLQFLCVKIVLANNASEAIQERCIALHTSTALTPPYPNPATDLLVLEWVSATEEMVSIRVINLSGKEVLAESFNAQQGLNTRRLSTQDWQSGLYLVKFKSTTADRTFRTIIAR